MAGVPRAAWTATGPVLFVSASLLFASACVSCDGKHYSGLKSSTLTAAFQLSYSAFSSRAASSGEEPAG